VNRPVVWASLGALRSCASGAVSGFSITALAGRTAGPGQWAPIEEPAPELKPSALGTDERQVKLEPPVVLRPPGANSCRFLVCTSVIKR
jgi:hypothetical protein